MKKLILVADGGSAAFYEAVGLKVKKLLEKIVASQIEPPHKRQDLHTGYTKKPRLPSRFYDPHNDARDIERDHFARYLVEKVSDKKAHELILVAEPKMLHLLRVHLAHLAKEMRPEVIKEISKDLTQASREEIEKHVFSS